MNTNNQKQNVDIKKTTPFTHREIWKMIGLTIITFGIYVIYWIIKTKNELNKNGADIPHF